MRHRSSTPLWLGRLGVACALSGIALVGCAPAGPGPGDSVTEIRGGQVRITFAGIEYQGFGAFSEMPDPPDSSTLVIPPDALTSLGHATEADPALFPDRVVYAIRNVAPRDAVVMFDRSGPAVEVVVFTRMGTNPTLIVGLCDYYPDPALRLCHPQASGPP